MHIAQAVVLLAPHESASQIPAENVSKKKMLGLTLVERLLLTASRAGIREFILVGRDLGSGLLSFLSEDKRFRGLGVRAEYRSAAGLADPGLQSSIREYFWILSGDLVLDPAILAAAAGRSAVGRAQVLHVINSPAMDAPGPEKPPDGYAGVSLCSKEVFPALAAGIKQGGFSASDIGRSDGVFSSFRQETLEADPRFCLRVESKSHFQKAERYLLSTARKPTDGFFARHFNRHISLFLTRIFLRTNVGPIPLSLISFIIGLSSGWFVGKGGYENSVLGAFLFEFASIFDGCDGENARLTFRVSKLGGSLDVGGDAMAFAAFFFNLPVGLYCSTQDSIYLYLAAAAFLSISVFYIVMAGYSRKSDLGHPVAIVDDMKRMAARSGRAGWIDRLALKLWFVYRRDFFATLVFLLVIAGGIKILMWLIAVLSFLEALYFFFFSRRRFRTS
jgi:CDP-L-myo-inositol myo-inositolphosphotransferase